MPEDLPPTALLRAFSRVAETLSLKEAAADLHLSPSAVSRQIQSLEAYLGVTLFRRLNPGLEITDEGRRYLRTVNRVLGELRRAQQELTQSHSGPLRVSALESFTESWLIPHLSDFERAHPGVELQIEATLRYADFERDPVDVAIRFGRGPWGDLHSEPIVDLTYYPVCSPTLGGEPLREPRDLRSHVMLHVSQTPDAWEEWLRQAGVAGLQPKRSISYDHVSIALSAAESGHGVALSSDFLCAKRLAMGRLVTPFSIRAISASTYHLVCRPEGLADPRIVALRDWLVDALG